MIQISSNIASSQDSSSDSSTSSPQHPYDGPNVEAESQLPGVLMSQQPVYAQFFCQLMALGSQLEFPLLRDGGRALLQLMPCDGTTVERLRTLFSTTGERDVTMDSMFFSATAAEVSFRLWVIMVSYLKSASFEF